MSRIGHPAALAPPPASLAPITLLVLVASACTPDVDTYIKSAGWVTTEASGSLAIDLSTVIYNNQYGLNSGVFTEDGQIRHDEVADSLYANSVGDTYCGTDNDACADGDISTITVVFDGVETEVDYPTFTVPPPLEEADTYVYTLIESLETCVSSLELTIDAECVKISAP